MSRKMLGLSFGQRSLLVAEIVSDGKTVELLKRAEFELPAPAAVAKDAARPAGTPDASKLEAGKKFAEFLKQNGFSAKQACIGLPTQWLMLKEKSLPAVAAQNLVGMLSLQAERDFSLEPKDLILDYCSAPTKDAADRPGLKVLLAAALRERVEQCVAFADAAGLSVQTVSASALELAQALDENFLIHAGPFGADLLVKTGGGLFVPVVLSSASKPEEATAWAAGIGSEARRVLALREGLNEGEGANSGVALWNGAGLDARALDALETALGRGVRVLTELKGPHYAIRGLSSASRFALAAVLARRGISDRAASLNFLDSKLVEKKKGALSGVKGWMFAAAVLMFGLLVALAWNWFSVSREYAALKKQSDTRKAEVESAKTFLARYASAQGWYDKRPNILDSMKALARVIPVDGSAWIANLSMKEDFHCVVSMRAVDTKTYFDVFDAIEKDDTFREVKLVYMTQPDKKKSEVSFAVSFVYWAQ